MSRPSASSQILLAMRWAPGLCNGMPRWHGQLLRRLLRSLQSCGSVAIANSCTGSSDVEKLHAADKVEIRNYTSGSRNCADGGIHGIHLSPHSLAVEHHRA